MNARLLVAALFFIGALVATVEMGEWASAPMLGPLSALLLAALGTLLLGLAPPMPRPEVDETELPGPGQGAARKESGEQ